jgi:hypothetical protein
VLQKYFNISVVFVFAVEWQCLRKLSLPLLYQVSPYFSVTNLYTQLYPFTIRTSEIPSCYDLKLPLRQYTVEFSRAINHVDMELSVRRFADWLWLHQHSGGRVTRLIFLEYFIACILII